MAKDVPLRIGQKIQVNRGDGSKLYNSGIQDVQNDTVSITIPYLKEHPLVLQKDDEVMVRFVRDDNCYVFTTRVLGKAQDNITLYRLAYPNEIQRVQQRMHCRIPVNLDVQFAVLGKGQKAKSKPAEYKKGISVDISGGGMRIATRELLRENDRLMVKFTLPLKDNPWPMKLKARVIRSFLVDPATKLYHVGIKFEELNHNLEDKIVRFTFERMALQKRLL